MTQTERTPHPARNLPGFTRAVTLSTGLEVHIRKVDAQAVMLSAAREEQTRRTAAGLGSELREDDAGLVLEVQRRLLRTALIEPTLAELMAAYGGAEEQEDFGLGGDMSLILDALTEHNGGPKKDGKKK